MIYQFVMEAHMDSTTVGLIIGVVLVILTVLLIYWGRGKENARGEAATNLSAAAAIPQEGIQGFRAASAPAKPDDLVIIEGIGPKIAELLAKKGITTFAQLAVTDVPRLEKILRENGLQFTKPGSWPEQARLAADGRMDELKALQDKLIAGR
jgi:predicted flap endonuclease-1-like 5' DNA nuclease